MNGHQHERVPEVAAMLHTFTAFMTLKDPVLLASFGLLKPTATAPKPSAHPAALPPLSHTNTHTHTHTHTHMSSQSQPRHNPLQPEIHRQEVEIWLLQEQYAAARKATEKVQRQLPQARQVATKAVAVAEAEAIVATKHLDLAQAEAKRRLEQ